MGLNCWKPATNSEDCLAEQWEEAKEGDRRLRAGGGGGRGGASGTMSVPGTMAYALSNQEREAHFSHFPLVRECPEAQTLHGGDIREAVRSCWRWLLLGEGEGTGEGVRALAREGRGSPSPMFHSKVMDAPGLTGALPEGRQMEAEERKGHSLTQCQTEQGGYHFPISREMEAPRGERGNLKGVRLEPSLNPFPSFFS